MKRFITSLVLLCLVTVGLIMSNTQVAKAGLCITPPEAGNWRNNDSATRGITMLDFRLDCRDASTTTCSGDICSTTSAVESHHFVNLYGKCHPTDCVWGEVKGQAQSGNVAGWYYFYYDQGFAKRYVWVRTYSQWPGWLRLWIFTDFSDPGRADYTSDDWFVRR